MEDQKRYFDIYCASENYLLEGRAIADEFYLFTLLYIINIIFREKHIDFGWETVEWDFMQYLEILYAVIQISNKNSIGIDIFISLVTIYPRQSTG